MSQVKEISKSVLTELLTSPLNILLLFVCGFLAYKIFRLKRSPATEVDENDKSPVLTKMKKRDFTVEELKPYNGVDNDEKRILVAVNYQVFDVTNKGKSMYGPGGPYSAFAGRDASRALATFSLAASALRDAYDDLSDLTSVQLESLKEWEMQFIDKYQLVGKLLKPNEAATEYSDSDDEPTPVAAAAGPAGAGDDKQQQQQ